MIRYAYVTRLGKITSALSYILTHICDLPEFDTILGYHLPRDFPISTSAAFTEENCRYLVTQRISVVDIPIVQVEGEILKLEM